MCVGGFEDLVVSPERSVDVIVVMQLLKVYSYEVLVAGTTQNRIGDLYDLCAVDGVVRAERAIRITVDPTLLSSGGNSSISPVGRRYIGKGLGTAGELIETRSYSSKLCARDRSIRLK